MRKIAITLLTACVGGAVAVGSYRLIETKYADGLSLEDKQKVYFTNNPVSVSSAGNVDFVAAAAAVTPGVVHIKTTYAAQQGGDEMDLFGDLFGGGGRRRMMQPAMASGSGVIISPDGYIATNNHVVENASKIEVVLADKHSYEAKVIGRDPNTDLALIKVSASNLPVVKLGNSDNVQVGEWVLAVGYPFTLNTTVTAGIVSAKGRNIGILGQQERNPFGRQQQDDDSRGARLSAIESFIQTDAAINRGNSGGALVNAQGELIGINAAIASQSGNYEGYGFAIPINLAKKVLQDFKEFGTVKRGVLGVNYYSPEQEEVAFKQDGIDPATVNGAYITGVQEGSAAASAGLKKGDIIRSIDGINVNSSTEFAERIARHRPGDKVAVGYVSGGSLKTAQITLKGEESIQRQALAANNNPAVGTQAYARLGASFAPLTTAQKQKYRVNSGVMVTSVKPGGLFASFIPQGTVITSINGKAIARPSDISLALSASKNNQVTIQGITPDGGSMTSTFPLPVE